MDATSAIALVVALGGWVLAAVTAWINYRSQTAATFFQALDWMSGGTQKRSIGIAAIEGAWHNRRFRRLSTPLVCSSCIYLLLRSRQRDSADELSNLRRMMALATGQARVRPGHRLHFQLLLDALRQRSTGPNTGLGLEIADEQIAQWRRQVASLAGLPEAVTPPTEAAAPPSEPPH